MVRESGKPQVSIIVAYNGKGVIGNNLGKVPWHLPADLKFFKDMTMGHACVMGRKTWDSIPKNYRPLPGRYNVVVTRNHSDFEFPEGSFDKVAACVDVETAIQHAKQFSPGGEVFITGGAQIYNYCIERGLADRVLASEIKNHIDVEGVAFFPNLKEIGWKGTVFKEYDEFTVMDYRKP